MPLDQSVPDVFLIDDDEEIRLSTAALLNPQGISVIQFDSAEDFLSRTDNTIRGCVISDFQMEGELNGIDLLKIMRVGGYQLPVVLVSGSLKKSDQADAIASGAYAVIEKPYPPQFLLETVKKALNEPGT
ncbi:response regulator transcription factor [Gimesia panareensis]|uniref:response regulator transcription factor n=1 Tax=Gimesia panareensis TaxID=2527978 RepID=UPI0018D6EFDA|nr:response regulator [Gimesia panareensis]